MASQTNKELLHNGSGITPVALLAGSLDRDKIFNKSCVSYIP
jgi:hypothetical protein